MRKNSIRLRIANNSKGEQVFKAIIAHPMETGRRKNLKNGQIIPADYIDEFRISIDGEIYFEVTLGEYVSKNPYLSFVFVKRVVEAQLIQINWVDNNEIETSYDFVVNYTPDRGFSFTGDKNGSELMQLLPQAGPVCKTKPPIAVD